MENRVLIAIALIVAAFLTPGPVHSQAKDMHASPPNPLAKFERLIGGQWHLDGSYQEFEWGVGSQSVIARSYFLVDGKPKLVSEGMWYWHPEERTIKGVFTRGNIFFRLGNNPPRGGLPRNHFKFRQWQAPAGA